MVQPAQWLIRPYFQRGHHAMAVDLLARSFDLERPGVAPPLRESGSERRKRGVFPPNKLKETS